MSRTTIPISHWPAISRAVLLALLLAVTATVIWQVAPPAGTDGTSVGRRAGSVESAPIAPLRQLERAEQVRTATLRNGRPERRLAPRPNAQAAFLSELRRDSSRATGPTPALDQQIAQLEQPEALRVNRQVEAGAARAGTGR